MMTILTITPKPRARSAARPKFNHLMDLREQFGLTYLFIIHDLSVVQHSSVRIVIMYLGRIAESGPSKEFFAAPNHPYARALLEEIPRVDPPPGCHFHPRCPHAIERFRVEAPALRTIAPGRLSACHLNEQT